VTFLHRNNSDEEATRSPAIFDRRWHAKALAGDSESVALLARQVLGPLFRFCYHRLGRNQALAEDVVQETLLIAIERLETYDSARSGGRIWGWITGLARNEIRRALSRYEQGFSLQQFWESADVRLLEALRHIESEAISDADVVRNETRQLVNVTMSQLPVHYQQALEAKYMNGESLRQIAAALSLSVEAVESLLSRSRRAFRETFEILSRPKGAGEYPDGRIAE
jgi:RNA polymerase sigma-70 factor, ECF subfamily